MPIQVYTIEDGTNIVTDLSPLTSVDKNLYYTAACDALEYPTSSSAQADCSLAGGSYIVVGPHPHPHR